MTKFKIGDSVRIKEGKYMYGLGFVGCIGTVVYVSSSGPHPYDVRLEGMAEDDSAIFSEDELADWS